jgi:hypothetical protein
MSGSIEIGSQRDVLWVLRCRVECITVSWASSCFSSIWRSQKRMLISAGQPIPTL